jgi:large subunit ribosomal protein L13
MDTHYFSEKEIERKWYLIDAEDKILGKVASKIATILIGKNKPEYTPNADLGDFVVVINASKVKVSAEKEQEKIYFRHSLYPGGLKRIPLQKMRANNPTYIIRAAVWGMVKHSPLGRKAFKKLKIYADEFHPHAAQKPINLEI